MSLVAFALRTCTVRALRGATLAGANVIDSPVDPSDTAAKATTPTIFVFSDAEHVQDIETRAILAGNRRVDLSLLIVLPATFQAAVGGTTIEFQDRKAGAAAALDIIYRQIERALLTEATPWAALWSRFVIGVEQISAQAYVLPVTSGKETRHLPARAITVCIHPIYSAPIGQAPQGVWADLITLMQADPGLSPIAPLIASAIEGDDLPQWRVDAIALGDTVQDAQDIGYAALGGGPADALATMTEATLLDPAPGSPDPSFTIDDGVPLSFEP